MNLEATVRSLYQDIDAQHWTFAFEIFSDTIRYKRNHGENLLVIQGKQELEDFYRNKRDLTGRHELESVKVSKDTVMVEGNFIGRQSGKPIKLAFTDKFVLNDDGKITMRESMISKSTSV